MSDTGISVNIVCMDHYLHSPIKDLDPFMSEFRASNIERLPILRIYGSTYAGVKACVHIHGVFPYFYVPCSKDCKNTSAVAYQLASAVDKAINLMNNQATSSKQHVYSVTLENGIPFYGYHDTKHQFFKLSFYNPTMIKKASALLQSGNIMGAVFQPFECHIPYTQQFMIDFNLFGMNFVRFANPRYRDDVALKKQSVCPLEFDVLAADVLNQYDIVPGNVTCNPGIQYIRDEELKRDGKSRNAVEEVESCLTQNRVDVEPTSSDISYREKLRSLLKARSSQKSETSASGLSSGTSHDLNDTVVNSASLLDISVMDDTQLEENAQMLMGLWKDNCDADVDVDLDDDCVLSQQQKVVEYGELEQDEDDFNFSLLDFMSSLESTGEKTSPNDVTA